MKIAKHANSNETPKKILKDRTIVSAGVYESSIELDQGDAAI